VPQRVFVDADVLVTRTPFCWLAMLRDETDGAFRLYSSDATLAAATEDWRSRHPDAAEVVAERREQLLRAVLDDVTDDGAGGEHVRLAPEPARDDAADAEVTTPDEFLCLVDDAASANVRALTLRRQDDLERRRQAGIPTATLVDALVTAGCPAFAERVAAYLRTGLA